MWNQPRRPELNHTNYARWLPVHLRDMSALQQTAPGVFLQFEKRLFTDHKSPRRFSALLSIRHTNRTMGWSKEMVGLWALQTTLVLSVDGWHQGCKWQDFWASLKVLWQQKLKFKERITMKYKEAFKCHFLKTWNPLSQRLKILVTLSWKKVATLSFWTLRKLLGPAAVTILRQIEAVGKEQCNQFITERLLNRTKSLYDPIKRNKVSLFIDNFSPTKESCKTSKQLSSMKSDCALFARLYISCQTRVRTWEHENQGCPPSLSHVGKLCPPKKYELTECLEANTTRATEVPSAIDATVIDGAAVVNMIKPGTKTFSGYAEQSFLPYVKTQLRHVKCVDIVWDEYVDNSFKATTRSYYGAGVRRRVAANNQLPRNWKEFLRVDKNRHKRFKFLAESSSSLKVEKQVILTYRKQVLTTLPCNDISSLAPCSHEEADTRMLLHIQDALQEGHKKILLCTVDTDVLVLAVALRQQVSEGEHLEIWVAFGTENHF